jgi:hypothetical protein
MPKSRGRKKKRAPQAQVVKMTPQVRDALLEQRAAFIAKFGREPGPDDRSSSTLAKTCQLPST